MKIAVIGAGPAGLTAAYQLSKETCASVDVFEAGNSVGGFSKTIELWNYKVDLGPHRFFSTDFRVNRLWLEVIGDDYLMIDRLTRIYYKGRYFDYPLRFKNALSNLGFSEAIQSLFSYINSQINPLPDNKDFESWVSNKFGNRLYQIFFKSYSEKLWGISCRSLDADFAAQRIKDLSLFEAIKAMFSSASAKNHKTLVDRFAYPVKGTGWVYERMKNKIIENGATVSTNTKVKKVVVKNGKACGIMLEDGATEYYDHIVSTMPLTRMVNQIDDAPKDVKQAVDKLKFRNTLLVYLHIEGKDLFPDNWLYINSDDLKMGRVTNFRNWSPHLFSGQEGTVISIEYWCNNDDLIWNDSVENIIELAKEEISSTQLIKNNKIIDGKVYLLPNCYPIYEKGYKNILFKIKDYLKGIDNLSVIGRYGAFKYNNQDHSILMGILAAENILDNANHDLWSVNTDYENYQERATISETGLVIS